MGKYEIRSCPWCTMAPKFEIIDGDWCVYCDNSKCLVQPFTYGAEKEMVARQWNTRPGEAITNWTDPAIAEDTGDRP